MSRRRIMDDPIIISTQTNAPVMKVLWDKGVADREHSFSHGEAVKRVYAKNDKNDNEPAAKIFADNQEIEHFDEFKYFTGVIYWGNGMNRSGFWNCTNLKVLTLPRSLKNIGNWYSYQKSPFTNTAIEYLRIPDEVETTTDGCFFSMPKLKTIVWGKKLPFNNSVMDYGVDGTFSGDSNLEYVLNFPSQVTGTNYRSCFSGCKNIKNWNEIFPSFLETAKSLPAKAFNDTNLNFAEATFKEVTSITGDYHFTSEKQTRKDYNIYYGSILNLPKVETFYMHYTYGNVKYVNVGPNCTSLSSNSTYAFKNDCHIRFTSNTIPPHTTASPNWDGNCRLYVPEELLEDYKSATGYSANAAKIFAYKDPSTARFCSFPSTYTIPSDYTEVAYIEKLEDGKSSPIWTNYQVNSKMQILLDFSHEWHSESETRFLHGSLGKFNAYIDTDYTIPGININSYSGSRAVNMHHYWHPGITGEDFGSRSIFKMNDEWMSYHNRSYQMCPSTSEYVNTENLGVMTIARDRNWRFYRLTIFDYISGDINDPSNYTLARDYIPVKRNSDNKYGAYDYVTGHFAVPSGANADNYPFSGPTE